ncbi:HEAT repeat domain-containing protein [candidate division KSB1 bacterium]
MNKKYLYIIIFALLFTSSISVSASEQDPDAVAYKAAYQMILNENYVQAQKSYANFLQKFKKSKYRDDAAYWQSFAVMKLARNNQAQLAMAFEMLSTFVDTYPESRWTDDAKTNMITIHQKLNTQDKRKYQRIVVQFRRSRDEEVALAAIQALTRIDEKAAVPDLIEIYNQSKSENVKNRIISMLVRYDAPTAQDKLYEILQAIENENDRKTIITLLDGRYIHGPLLDLLENIVWNESDHVLQRKALKVIIESPNIENIRRLAKIYQEHPDDQIRLDAIFALERKEIYDPQMAIVLKTIIFESADVKIQDSAVRNLSMFNYPGKNDHLKEIARNHENPDIRISALYTIARQGDLDAEIENILEDIIFASNERSTIAQAIHTYKYTSVDQRMKLIRRILREHSNDEIRSMSFDLFDVQMSNDDMLDLVYNVIKNDKNTLVQHRAAYCLKYFKSQRAAEVIKDVMINHPNPEVREQAIFASSTSDFTYDFKPEIEQIIFNDPEESVRIAAMHFYPINKEKVIHDNYIALLKRILESGQSDEIKTTALLRLSLYQKDIIDDYIDLLGEMLFSANSSTTRNNIFSILGSSESPDANKYLIRVVKESEDLNKKISAVQHLSEKNAPELIETLDELIFAETSSELNNFALISAIRQRNDEMFIPLLIKIAKTHKNVRTRTQAIHILGQSKDPRAVEALLEIIKKDGREK